MDLLTGLAVLLLVASEAESHSVPGCFSDEYQACLAYGGGFGASASGQTPDESCSGSEELQDWQGSTCGVANAQHGDSPGW